MDTHPNPAISDILPPWKQWTDRYTKFFSYLRTRRAVRTGSQLWNSTAAELKAGRLLEPWPFNLYQSALSALPGVVLVSVLSFLGIEMTQKLVFESEFQQNVWRHFEKVQSYLEPLIIPLTLAITCFGAARASLDSPDRSKLNVARARRAYLYLDGAYGLWTQALLSIWATLYYSPIRGHLGVAIAFGSIVMFGVVLWQNTISTWKLPKALFAINGYDRPYPKSWFWFRRDANSTGWRRFKLYVYLLIPVAIAFLIGAIYTVAYVSAYALALSQEALKRLLL